MKDSPCLTHHSLSTAGMSSNVQKGTLADGKHEKLLVPKLLPSLAGLSGCHSRIPLRSMLQDLMALHVIVVGPEQLRSLQYPVQCVCALDYWSLPDTSSMCLHRPQPCYSCCDMVIIVVATIVKRS